MVRMSNDAWTFLTNHAQVLLCIADDPQIRLRDVAERVGITERAAQRIVADLVDAGYVETSRIGRRNHYTIDRKHPMRHAAQDGYDIDTLLESLALTRDGRRLSSTRASRARSG